jgi:hypothetical protein
MRALRTGTAGSKHAAMKAAGHRSKMGHARNTKPAIRIWRQISGTTMEYSGSNRE